MEAQGVRCRLVRSGARRALGALLAAGLLGLGPTGCLATRSSQATEIARAYHEAGRHAEAAREIELALRQAPDDVDLQLLAASIHAAAGHTERAIAHLELVQGVSPGNFEAALQLGRLEQQRGNAADAYVAFRRAAALAPDDVRAVSGLALSAEALGFEDEAAEAYARWEALEGAP